MTVDTQTAITHLESAYARLADAEHSLRFAVALCTGIGIETDWRSPAATEYRALYEHLQQATSAAVGQAGGASATVGGEIQRLRAQGV